MPLDKPYLASAFEKNLDRARLNNAVTDLLFSRFVDGLALIADIARQKSAQAPLIKAEVMPEEIFRDLNLRAYPSTYETYGLLTIGQKLFVFRILEKTRHIDLCYEAVYRQKDNTLAGNLFRTYAGDLEDSYLTLKSDDQWQNAFKWVAEKVAEATAIAETNHAADQKINPPRDEAAVPVLTAAKVAALKTKP